MAQGQWKAKHVKPAKYSGRGTPPYGAAVGLPAAVNVQGRVKDALGLIILHRIIGEVHPPAQVPDPKMMGYGAYGYNNRFGKGLVAGAFIPTFYVAGHSPRLRSGPRSHGSQPVRICSAAQTLTKSLTPDNVFIPLMVLSNQPIVLTQLLAFGSLLAPYLFPVLSTTT